MYQTKLCINLSSDYGIDSAEQIPLLHDIGFEGFFTGYDGRLGEYRELAEKHGMLYQSVHAPFGKIASLWTGDGADEIQETLLKCVNDCADVGVPIMVCHTYIGFLPSDGPNAQGIERYRRIVEAAGERGLKVAFENTEGEEYLAALMNAFIGYENVGFCWDTGHELCYNYGKDMTALYGDRLFCTHLNDNLGIRSYDGTITWRDDLHLLPFDGINDWQSIADRLNRHGYTGELTFEMGRGCAPGRHDKDKYNRMSIEEFLCEVYARACRVATLKNRGK